VPVGHPRNRISNNLLTWVEKAMAGTVPSVGRITYRVVEKYLDHFAHRRPPYQRSRNRLRAFLGQPGPFYPITQTGTLDRSSPVARGPAETVRDDAAGRGGEVGRMRKDLDAVMDVVSRPERPTLPDDPRPPQPAPVVPLAPVVTDSAAGRDSAWR